MDRRSFIRVFGVLILFIFFARQANGQCRERNETEAASIGRICRSECKLGSDTCGTRRTCMCDHECGSACINPASTCQAPPDIENQEVVHVFRRSSSGKLEIAQPPYLYDDFALYSCKQGYELQSDVMFHYCDSRRAWTGTPFCRLECSESSYNNAEDSILCGASCNSDSDCPASGRCQCNGHCGRSCTNPLFTPWIPIQSCSARCRGGYTLEARSCLSQDLCFGPTVLNVSCNTDQCPGVWTRWSSWGACSQSCNTGVQHRMRECVNPICHDDDSQLPPSICAATDCVGPFTGTQMCSTDLCPTWGKWQQHGECSASCGGGVLRISRNCSIGDLCPGERERTFVCHTEECPSEWLSWGSWSACSQSCNTGVRSRNRNCGGTNCPCDATEEEACSIQSCPEWSEWQPQGDCSKTCGGGILLLTRTCSDGDGCPGSSMLEVPCNTEPCEGVWSEWSNWGACTQSCGLGTQTRSRTCSNDNCEGSPTEVRDCQEPGCFSNWSMWSACSQTCDMGTQVRTRTCSKENCVGNDMESRNCQDQECIGQWNAWMNWSGCTASCAGGSQTRTRTCSRSQCPPGAPGPQETRSCNVIACPWGQWSSCNPSCGNGQRSRTRVCPATGNCNSMQAEACNDGWCPWGPWSSYGACSVPCGNGQQTRTRTCPANNCGPEIPPSETQTCQTNNCQWANWNSWSACDRTCGISTQTRNRICPSLGSCGPGVTSQTRGCLVPFECCSRNDPFCNPI